MSRPFFEVWFDQYQSAMPKEWSGILIGDENLFHNSGSLPHVRRSNYHRFFRSAQSHTKFSHIDAEMADEIPGIIPLTENAQLSSSGQMIFDAAAPKVKWLLEIQHIDPRSISTLEGVQELLAKADAEIKPIYISQFIQVSPDTPPIRAFLKNEIRKLNGQQRKNLFDQLKEDSSKGVFQGNSLLDLIVHTKAEYFSIIQTGRTDWAVQQGFIDRSVEASLDFFFSLNPDAGDVVRLLRASYSFATGMKIREYAIHRIRNVDEFIRIVRSEMDSKTPEEYQKLQDEFTLRKIGQFWALNPSMADVLKLVGATNSVEIGIELRRKALPLVRTPEDFLKLMQGEQDKLPADYRAKIDQLGIDNIGLFLATKPEAKEITKLTTLMGTVESTIAVRKAAMKQVKNATQYLQLLEVGIDKPSDEYVKALKNLRIETESFFWDLQPSISEIVAYLKNSDDTEECMRIRQKAFGLVSTPEDYVELFQFEIKSPSKKYRAAIEKHFDETVDQFLALDPSLDQANSLISLTSTVERTMKLKRWMAKKVRSPSDFLKLADMKISTPSGSYRSALMELLNEQKDLLRLVLSKPTYQEKLSKLGWQQTGNKQDQKTSTEESSENKSADAIESSSSGDDPQIRAKQGSFKRICGATLSKIAFWRRKK